MKPDFLCQPIGRCLCVLSLVLLSGGTTFLITGCDTEVSTAVLGGLQDLTNTIVDVAFESLANQLADTTTSTSTTGSTTTTSRTISGT